LVTRLVEDPVLSETSRALREIMLAMLTEECM
jgi:hypothetical protein